MEDYFNDLNLCYINDDNYFKKNINLDSYCRDYFISETNELHIELKPKVKINNKISKKYQK